MSVITLQLINGISNDLPKLLTCFSSTTIYTSSLFLFGPSSKALQFDLCLKDKELLSFKLIFPIVSSLLNCHKLPEVSK